MRILIFFLTASVFFSCTPMAPVSPAAAFYELKKSYAANDYDKTISLLSDMSITRIKKTSSVFTSMDEKALNAAASSYGVKPERLKNLSVKDFLAISSASGKQNVLKTAFERNIFSVDKSGSEAILTLDNGMKLRFIKSGPYWKFDMTEF